MRPKHDKYEHGGLKVLLSVDGIMGCYYELHKHNLGLLMWYFYYDEMILIFYYLC